MVIYKIIKYLSWFSLLVCHFQQFLCKIRPDGEEKPELFCYIFVCLFDGV